MFQAPQTAHIPAHDRKKKKKKSHNHCDSISAKAPPTNPTKPSLDRRWFFLFVPQKAPTFSSEHILNIVQPGEASLILISTHHHPSRPRALSEPLLFSSHMVSPLDPKPMKDKELTLLVARGTSLLLSHFPPTRHLAGSRHYMRAAREDLN